MRNLIYILTISLFWACSPDEMLKPYPCIDGDCNARFYIDEQVQPNAYQDVNNYWHIEFNGPKYFTIRGELDQLSDEYIINGVPLIETIYDSDYWIAFESLTFSIPIYSVLSWFSNGDWNNLIPIGNSEYTLTDLAQIQPPLNIAGFRYRRIFVGNAHMPRL